MFDKILIANRGEIACRVLRTCKRLGIATVAVYSEADADAPQVKNADEAILIGPPPVKDSYLNIEAIVAAARKTGTTAVHPGYGLLSENSRFATALADAGITFIGPPPTVLEAFGDKVKARRIAREAGVEPPPGTEEPVDPNDETAIKLAAQKIGFPILVKAAGGGGGIGMKIVKKEDKLTRAVASCADRGAAAFGDPRVYLERYINSPKHIEVQILCDDHGHAIALGERECSLQRRHQKIIEETPSPAPFFSGSEGALRRTQLHQAAVAIAKHANYRGAGTVEFVASPEGELFFLELNARLQVEHCVTEMCTGIDLVEQQLRVAAGMPLSATVLEHEFTGHSIEARIYAEDPAKRFAPQPGSLEQLTWPPDADWMRIETAAFPGMEVSPYYDPMIAKLVVHGPTRQEAIERMALALQQTEIKLVGPAGRANCNLAFCQQLINSAPFANGSYNTTHAEALAKAGPPPT